MTFHPIVQRALGSQTAACFNASMPDEKAGGSGLSAVLELIPTRYTYIVPLDFFAT